MAATDCERLGSGPFAQPVNAVSSLAFLLVGLWIVLRGRWVSEHRVELAVFGLAVASNAVGGLLFHGLQVREARWIHDVCVLSALLFVAVFDVARFRARPVSWTVRAFLASLGGVGLLLGLVPNATDALSASLGVVVGAGELAEYRHELPALRTEGLTARRLARLGVLAALALGASAILAGRTGGWLCSPGSVFQWHAAWHVLAALATGLYAYGAIEPHATAETPIRPS